MSSVFTIKLTHLTSGAEKLVPITDKEFKILITGETLDDDKIKDRVFADIMSRTSLVKDWYDHYNFNGIFLGTERKDRT